MAYVVDPSAVLLKLFRLSALFLGNKELRRAAAPDESPVPEALRALEARFFMSEASSLLLEIAIAIRVIDDQLMGLEADDMRRIEYERRSDDAQKFGPLSVFLSPKFEQTQLRDKSLRFICNKVIHARALQPLTLKADVRHLWDGGLRAAIEPRISWTHYTGAIAIAGDERKGKKMLPWAYLLDIIQFTRAAWSVLDKPLS